MGLGLSLRNRPGHDLPAVLRLHPHTHEFQRDAGLRAFVQTLACNHGRCPVIEDGDVLHLDTRKLRRRSWLVSVDDALFGEGGLAIRDNDGVVGENLFEERTAYETFCHGAGVHTIRVFRDIGDARRWLEGQSVSASPDRPRLVATKRSRSYVREQLATA